MAMTDAQYLYERFADPTPDDDKEINFDEAAAETTTPYDHELDYYDDPDEPFFYSDEPTEPPEDEEPY